jgi:site-specific DNA recombinase
MTDLTQRKIRVALYARVSSDEQRENQSIRTQIDILDRWVEQNSERVEVAGWFKDDGVSGTVALEKRPEGSRLVALAESDGIDQVVVTRADRLGRTTRVLIEIRDQLEAEGVGIFAVLENVEDPFDYEIRAVLAADERRRFLRRSKEGMERAAREGRYCGGIVPLGYSVEGKKQSARLVLSDRIIWDDWTEADLVRLIYRWLATDSWSTVRIADHLNALGVPTAYTKDARLLKDEHGKRTRHTQNLWRPGRIYNLVINPVYRGLYQYGRRSKTKRDPIAARIPALVSDEMWEAALETLSRNRLITKHGGRVNLLRSLMHCTTCELTFCAYRGNRNVVWYRCGGQTAHRGKLGFRCPSRSIRADLIEPLVRRDIQHLLLSPDPSLVEELQADAICTAESAASEAVRLMLERSLLLLPRKRDNVLEMRTNDLITLDEAKAKFEELIREEERLRARLLDVTSTEEPADEPLDDDLVFEIRRRAELGFDEVTWQEIIALLVSRIDVKTEVQANSTKKVTVTIRYRFPGVDAPSTDTRASQNYTNLKRVVVL